MSLLETTILSINSTTQLNSTIKCQDQEELRVHQIQGPMLPIPLHPRHQRQGEGREAEAIPATRSSSQRIEVKFLLEP